MVIAGPEMTIMPIPSPLAPHDHRDLRVRLPIDEAVDDLHPCAFERRGPKQILLLVEARLQFDHRGHRFARLGRGDQRVDHRRLLARALQRLLDRDHIGEIGRAHVCTPVTNAHIVCRLLLDTTNSIQYIFYSYLSYPSPITST